MLTYIRQAWLVLLLGLLFGTVLAGVNSWLGPMIAANETRAKQDAALAVIDGSAAAAAGTVTLTDAAGKEHAVAVYRITGADGALQGWAIPASGQGYSDTIKLIVGVNAAGTEITDFRVIYNQETPGLGNKIIGGGFRKRFSGKATDVAITAVNSPAPADDEIQALTGATISSQAVCDIIYTQLSGNGLLARLADYRPDDVQTTDTEN